MQNILIIGAGAVGQVYGYRLAQAGNRVTFMVKEKYQCALQAGLTLYNLGQDKLKKRPIQFTQYKVITNWPEAAVQSENRAWDQIYLCISSTALRSFDFTGLKTLLKPGTTLVLLQPGPQDYQLVSPHWPATQIVQGVISLISYNAPLRTEQVPESGIAFWLPPLVATPFDGPSTQVKSVIRTFRQSGMKAVHKKKLAQSAPYPTAAFMIFLTALEIKNWKLAALREDKELQKLVIRAIHETFQALSQDSGSRNPLWRYLVTPLSIRVLLRIGPGAVPLDLETYLEYHFTKVGDQTRLFTQSYQLLAQDRGLSTPAMEQLLRLQPALALH
ncbi:MAG: hypothetical protein MI864_22760 [Pseudomonadales bacterium]|nr:hypothetical protein [Pseudomonadales bacterium]